MQHFIDTVPDEEEKSRIQKDVKSILPWLWFLSHRVMTFKDVKLEEFYHFSRHIARLLPVKGIELPTFIQDMVNIDSLRISQTSEGGIALINKDAELPSRGVDSIIGVIEEDLDSLSVIIETLNETYGANLTDEDKLFLGTLLDSLQAMEISKLCSK